MAHTAVIDSNGKVVNVIEADASFTMPGFTLVQSNAATIGSTYASGVFTPPPVFVAVAVPDEVKNWQGLAVMMTTPTVGAGSYDAQVRAIIAAMPSPQNVIVLAAYESSDFILRSPTLNALLCGPAPSGLGLTTAQRDALFVAAAALSL